MAGVSWQDIGAGPLNAALGTTREVVVEYRPVSRGVFELEDDHAVLQAVALHAQAAGLASPTDYHCSVPEAARTLWVVWCFLAEAGASGIPGYLANHASSTKEVIAFHRALQAIGADELVALFEAAVALLRHDGVLPDDEESSWFQQFSPPSGSTWEAVEARSFELLSGPLAGKAAAFARAHKSEL